MSIVYIVPLIPISFCSRYCSWCWKQKGLNLVFYVHDNPFIFATIHCSTYVSKLRKNSHYRNLHIFVESIIGLCLSLQSTVETKISINQYSIANYVPFVYSVIKEVVITSNHTCELTFSFISMKRFNKQNPDVPDIDIVVSPKSYVLTSITFAIHIRNIQQISYIRFIYSI